MADVTARDRGQLFLVTALTLAVLFVALAVLLNTAIYTENLATRGGESSGADALQRRVAAIEAGTALVEHENYRGALDYGTITGNVTAGVRNWSDAAALHDSYSGQSTNLSVAGFTRGARVAQTNATRNFTAGNVSEGATDWTLAQDVRARNVTMRVRPSDLDNRSPGFDPDDLFEDDATFNVTVTNGTDEWAVAVYDYNHTAVNVTVDAPSGRTTCSYDYPAGAGDDLVRLDFVTGSVGNQSCEALAFLGNVSGPYTVRYHQADAVAGTYNLVVDETVSGLPDDPYEAAASGASPFKREAVYAVRLTVSYVTPELSYRTTVRVAPGEPDA